MHDRLADWLHGELWCLDDGWLRTQLSLARTLGHGFWPTVNRSNRTTREFDASEIGLAEQASIRNPRIPRDEIQVAWLRRGLINGRLEIETDDRLVHLMWFGQDGAFDFLLDRPAQWLGDDLSVR